MTNVAVMSYNAMTYPVTKGTFFSLCTTQGKSLGSEIYTLFGLLVLVIMEVSAAMKRRLSMTS